MYILIEEGWTMVYYRIDVIFTYSSHTMREYNIVHVHNRHFMNV